MRIVMQDMAHNSINSISDYLSNYSIKNSIKTINKIYDLIYTLRIFPYIGRAIFELSDKNFREIIYKRNKQTSYKIIYYISEIADTIYIISIINCNQNFKSFLKIHNYFKGYYNF